MPVQKRQLVHEVVGGQPYEFYPLGDHVVSAPSVCDGQPTFKYTRIAVQHALELLAGGQTVEQVAEAYRVPVQAVCETIDLATEALIERVA